MDIIIIYLLICLAIWLISISILNLKIFVCCMVEQGGFIGIISALLTICVTDFIYIFICLIPGLNLFMPWISLCTKIKAK